jgi:glycosyltransferase involved in cell wall biosynthesis
MTKTVLVCFPHNLWPPRTGAHRRGLEFLGGLRELGCRVELASSTLSTDTPWEPSSVEGLKAAADAVHLYEAAPADYAYRERLRKFYEPDYLWLPVVRRLHPLGRREPPLDTRMHTPPGMRRWFDRVVGEFAPDAIVMNYAYWDRLIDHARLKSVRTVIDTIDLLSLNVRMQKAVRQSLPSPLSLAGVGEEVLREDFFERQRLSASAAEFRIYDRYDCSVAITASEAEAIRRRTRRTKVVLVPMTQEPRHVRNRYADPPLFPFGPNFFNTQGYLYFVKRVLPLVRAEAPSFELRVTGFYGDIIPPDPVEGIIFAGFLPDLKEAYEGAGFAVCPVFGGTGQQVKIVEAMAHGVPVVALKPAADRSPLLHGVNGLVAHDAEEFAAHVVSLWNDRELCRRLGGAARETIVAGFSRETLLRGLEEAVTPS